ncbi:MAG: branched-chain amino acid ABC transporter permease [Alphaproteobacteria bacterium]|nr:branched-chain amino acid ABC transporter permease [Alphaproteobacteria bacterium]
MFGSPPLARFAPLALLLIAGLALPHLLPQYFLFLGNILMMYAVLALGLDVLLGWAGQFAFAHVAFFGIGTYTTALLQARLGVPFVVGMPLGAALAGLIGLLIGLPATRLRTVYLALATFAFAEAAQWVFNAWDKVTGGPDGLRISAPSVLGYATGSDPAAFPVMAVILALMIAATMYLTTSKLGRAMCAVRESEHVAAASGIDVNATKVAAFAISAIYAGVAGGMFTLFQSFVNPEVFSFGQIVLLLSMIVVGGLGSIPGALIGVGLLGLLPEIMRTTMREFLVWQEFGYGVILVLVIMFMPRGVWGMIAARRRGR